LEDAEIRIEVYSSDGTAEIVAEPVNDLARSERRRFAQFNIPKHLFSSVAGRGGTAQGNVRTAASVVVD
jgi:hypothetical protein